MKRIVILGSSPAGIQAVEEVRAVDQHSRITVIGLDGHYPYNPNLFPQIIAREAAYSKVFCRPKDFYEKNNIEVILDKKITRVNLNRRRISTEEKDQYEYDTLIIAQAPAIKLPDIKGTNKNGVFGFKRFKDIDQMIQMLPLVETVAVQADSFFGLQIAAAFLKRKKEVILVTSGRDILPSILPPSVAKEVGGILEGKGLSIIYENAISEILGDGDAKAIRLKTGKVLSAQIVIPGQAREDFKLFAESPLKINRRICVDGRLKTGVEHVFAVGNACESDLHVPSDEDPLPSNILQEQGRVLGAVLKGEEASLRPLMVTRSLSMEGLDIDLIGETRKEDILSNYAFGDHEKKMYKQLFAQNARVTGAFLVYARQDFEKSIQSIENSAPLEDFSAFLSQPADTAHSMQNAGIGQSPGNL